MVQKETVQNKYLGGFRKDLIDQLMEITGVFYDGTLKGLVIAQKEWVCPAGTERWELETIHEDKRTALMPLFSELGLVQGWEPAEDTYEHILFMGGLVSRMVLRLQTLAQLIVQSVSYKKFTFLSGERYLTEEEKNFLKERGWSCIPETEAGVYPYLFEKGEISLHNRECISVPQSKSSDGSVYRPTTADTVNAWLRTNPASGQVLIISSQPLCLYQETIVKSLVPSSFLLTTVGEKAPSDTPVALYLDTIARIVEIHYRVQKK